jgi:carbonic anhydrase
MNWNWENSGDDNVGYHYLMNLLENNEKFVASFQYENQRKWFQKNNQRPKAIIVCCSDSRVPPEIIFQKFHLGELFIIRTAGHVLDLPSLESILFAVRELECKCIIVLGHKNCGAVTYVKNIIDNYHQNDQFHIYENLIKIIAPSIIENKINNNNIFIFNQGGRQRKIVKEIELEENIKNHTYNTCKYIQKMLHLPDNQNIIFPCFYDTISGKVYLI